MSKISDKYSDTLSEMVSRISKLQSIKEEVSEDDPSSVSASSIRTAPLSTASSARRSEDIGENKRNFGAYQDRDMRYLKTVLDSFGVEYDSTRDKSELYAFAGSIAAIVQSHEGEKPFFPDINGHLETIRYQFKSLSRNLSSEQKMQFQDKLNVLMDNYEAPSESYKRGFLSVPEEVKRLSSLPVKQIEKSYANNSLIKCAYLVEEDISWRGLLMKTALKERTASLLLEKAKEARILPHKRETGRGYTMG